MPGDEEERSVPRDESEREGEERERERGKVGERERRECMFYVSICLGS